MGETEILANYVARARYEQLPADVVAHAKMCISDAIACGLGGRKNPDMDILIGLMKDLGGKPEATVVGDRTRLSFLYAAQVNRVMMNMLDYDDTLIKVGHMSSILVPVALAVGERFHASGKEIITSIVLGYEVIARIRDAIHPTEEAYWSTFKWVDAGAHFGVAAATGKLLGLKSKPMADAFGLCGFVHASRVTYPDRAVKGMPRWMKIAGGDILLPGIQAVLLAQKGFSGDRQILDQGSGYSAFVGSDRYTPAKLTADLGREYQTLGIGFKYYSACRHTSSTCEAVTRIVSAHGIKPEDVERVTVRVQKRIAEAFGIYEPKHMIQAQFSMPYVVTMALMGEPTGPNWYQESKFKNRKIRELQHRVSLEEDPMAKDKFYKENKVVSTVELVTKSGNRFTEHVEYPKGEPENPFSQEDHLEKMRSMASWLGMKGRQISELVETLNRLERLRSVSELTRLLVPKR
jgi:2-methylcitrate dehydratase PrpD